MVNPLPLEKFNELSCPAATFTFYKLNPFHPWQNKKGSNQFYRAKA